MKTTSESRVLPSLLASRVREAVWMMATRERGPSAWESSKDTPRPTRTSYGLSAVTGITSPM